MKNQEQVKASESLLKNLMWLERGNALANHYELLEMGLTVSERIREQYKVAGEFYANEVLPFRTLHAAMRYVIEVEINDACEQLQPPRMEKQDEKTSSRERRLQKLSRGDKRLFSMAMPLGKSGQLGGGSMQPMNIQ